MGGFGRCCCDCCLEPEEMPYTTATLKLPNATTCEGEEPSEEDPVAEFVRESCCYKARFEFPCEPWTNITCSLYAKQTADFSFDATLYRSKVLFVPPGNYPPDTQFDCDCIAVQTRNVSVQSAARLFFRQSRRLKAISISVGKVRVLCSGETESACKYYVAASWEFEINEELSRVQLSSTGTTTGTGDYEVDNCSVSNSWVDQSGVNSDDCGEHDEEDLSFIGGPTTVSFSRMKLYDTLPDIGDVTITESDDSPFSCCDGKTGCTVLNYNCGLSPGTNCLPPIPTWPMEPGGLGFFRLIPCTLQIVGQSVATTPEPIYFDSSTGQFKCFEVIENGYEQPGSFANNVYQEGSPCYLKISRFCNTIGVGIDRIGRLRGFDELGVPLYTWSTMCGTAVVNECDINPLGDCRNTAFNDCFGGPMPPLPGLCQSGDCCSELLINGGVSTTQCPLLGPVCGYKFSNLSCITTRTNNTVGNTCVSLPSVTVGLA